MGSVRRASLNQFLLYLALNVVVSAATVTLVLVIWDARKPQAPAPEPTATLDVDSVVASAVPTFTATVPPSATPVTYTVQSGDTLMDIAVRLGVDIDLLMAVNGLSDPDTLSAGQVLLVPVGEQAQALLQPTPTPPSASAPATITPNPDAEAPRVEIRGVSGAGNLATETVLLLNTGGDAHMAGWALEDGQGRRYLFPIFTLHNGAVSVHTRGGTDTVIDLYWGLDEAVWLPGKVITLKDASGAVHSTFQIPAS
jgi:LysM repeat protein